MPKVNKERDESWGKTRKNTTWKPTAPLKRAMTKNEVRKANAPSPFGPKKR